MGPGPETNAVSTTSADTVNGVTPMEGLELTKPEAVQVNGSSEADSKVERPTPLNPEEPKTADKDKEVVLSVNGLKPQEPIKNINGIKEGMHSPLVASAV